MQIGTDGIMRDLYNGSETLFTQTEQSAIKTSSIDGESEHLFALSFDEAAEFKMRVESITDQVGYTVTWGSVHSATPDFHI